MDIKPAKDMNKDIKEKITELFVEAFGKDLKIISNDAGKLIKAFSYMFVPDYFYAGVINNEIAGMTACVDQEHYCIKPDRKIPVKNLGLIGGI